MRGAARAGDAILHGGAIVGANPSVITNGRATATRSSACACTKHGPAHVISGRSDVLVGGEPIARIRDFIACKPAVSPGAPPELPPGLTYRQLKDNDQTGKDKRTAMYAQRNIATKQVNKNLRVTYEHVEGELNTEGERHNKGSAAAVRGKLTVEETTWYGSRTTEYELKLLSVDYEMMDPINLANPDGTLDLSNVAKLGGGSSISMSETDFVRTGGRDVTVKRSGSLEVSAGAGGGHRVKYDPNTHKTEYKGAFEGAVDPSTGEGKLKVGKGWKGEGAGPGWSGELELEVKRSPEARTLNKITSASADVMVGG